MKRFTILPIALSVFALTTFFVSQTVYAKGVLEECQEKYDFVGKKYEFPQDYIGDSDPVAYYEDYIKTIECYLYDPETIKGDIDRGRTLSMTGAPASFFKKVLGIDLVEELADKCKNKQMQETCKPNYEACKDACAGKKGIAQCNKSCHDALNKCDRDVTKGCNDEQFAKLREYARGLERQPSADVPPVVEENPEAYAFCQPAGGLEGKLFPRTAHAQIYSNYSIVTHIEGEVLVKVEGSDTWAPAFKGQRIMIGDKIKTGRTGRAEVKFANSAIFRMRPLSQLEIPKQKVSECTINHKAGYLDMKFGKIWNTANGGPEVKVKTPNAVAGGVRRHNPLKSSKDSYIASNVLGLSIAYAAGNEITLHSYYNEDTKVSKFYVEGGDVDVMNSTELVTVPLSSGEQIEVAFGSIPKEEDVVLGAEVEEAWWKDDYNWGGLGQFSWVHIVLGALFVGVVVIVIRWVLRRKRR